MPAPALRTLFASSALLAVGCVASGCASSQMGSAYALNTPYPETARMGEVRGMEFYSICHMGRDMRISEVAVRLHLQHGDEFGACEASEDAEAAHAVEHGSGERGSTESMNAAE
jgi:hypothetical protein